MREAYARNQTKATSIPEGSFRISAAQNDNSACARIAAMALKLWPRKPDMALAHLTGKSDRTARYWLKQKYGMPADAFIALLQTNDGLKFLEAGMGDKKPAWWQAFKTSARIEILREAQQRQAEEIEQLASELLQ
jgi:hypothetical protein